MMPNFFSILAGKCWRELATLFIQSIKTLDTGCRVALPRGSERKWRAQLPEPVSWLNRAGNSGSCREKEKSVEEWYFSGLWRARDGRKWSTLRRKFTPLGMGGGVNRKFYFFLPMFSDFELFYLTRAEFLDNPHKRLFLLAIHSHLYSFALRFIFPQTHVTSYVFLLFSYCTL